MLVGLTENIRRLEKCKFSFGSHFSSCKESPADKVKSWEKIEVVMMELLLSSAATIMWILVMLTVIIYLVIVFILGEED